MNKTDTGGISLRRKKAAVSEFSPSPFCLDVPVTKNKKGEN
jgi:hypothetical protein